MRILFYELFSHELNDHFSCSGPRIKIDQHQLLPGAQGQGAFDERDGQGRPLQLAPKVGVAIIFTGIPRIMFPLWIGGNRLIPKCSRIGANARFIFNDHDGRGGMFDKHRQNAILQPGLGKRVLNALREILDVRISVHGNLHVVGFHGHDDSQIVTVCKKR